MTTKASLRQDISKLDNSYVAGSTTTNITTNTSIVDSKLEGIGYHNDDVLNECWVWLNTTQNASVERTIEDYTGATGTISVRGANLAAESGSAAFEVHKRFRPSDIHDALEFAIDNQFDRIFEEIVSSTLHTQPNQSIYDIPSTIQKVFKVLIEDYINPEFEENILYLEGHSVDFSDWAVSTKPDGSDTATNITLTEYGSTDQQEKFTLGNDRLCKAVSSGSAGTHYWTAIVTPADFGGIELTYEELIYCKTTEEVKVTIVDDQGSTASSYHGGTGWERVRVTHSVTDSPTSLKAGITTAGNSVTFYRKYAILTRAETYVEKPPIEWTDWTEFNGQLRFGKIPLGDKVITVLGKNPLSTLSADTTTVDLTDSEAQILIHGALVYLYDQLRQQYSHMENNPYNEDVIYLQTKLNQMRKRYGMMGTGVQMSPCLRF